MIIFCQNWSRQLWTFVKTKVVSPTVKSELCMAYDDEHLSKLKLSHQQCELWCMPMDFCLNWSWLTSSELWRMPMNFWLNWCCLTSFELWLAMCDDELLSKLKLAHQVWTMAYDGALFNNWSWLTSFELWRMMANFFQNWSWLTSFELWRMMANFCQNWSWLTTVELWS